METTNKGKKRKGKFSDVGRRLIRNKLAIMGFVVLIFFTLAAVFADFIIDYDVAIAQNTALRFQPPSSEHPLGTDSFGRDVLARVIHGAKYSLLIGTSAAAFATIVGGVIGAVAGFYGGIIDSFLMRTIDTILAIPAILLAIAIITAMGAGLINLIIAVAIASVPIIARLVRVSVLSVRSQEYIEAARSIACSDFVILFRHIIPNIVGPVIVQTTQTMATSILAASSLSFIGLGITPPTPEWGAMLSDAAGVIRHAPYLIYAPGMAIFLVVLSINFLGDGLRDALDPRLK